MQPFWRPNFVNQSALPDIKVVRTDFIINFIAVTIALCAAFFLLQREYRSYALGKTIQGMEQQIRVADSDDVENLKLSGLFRKSAQYIVEVENFFDAPLLVHEFMYNLAVIRPDGLIFNSVSLSERMEKQSNKNVVTYSINITGDAKNLTVLDDFKKILMENDILQVPEFTLEIDETLQGRDDKTGIFPYRVAIKLSPAEKKPAAAGEAGGDES
jgi:hypothetical protein